jgi:LydA holin phage, holin superfamily III
MPEKDLLNYPFLTYVWVIAMAALGGIAHYIKKINAGLNKSFSIAELAGEIVISGFVGLLTFFICDATAVDIRITAVFVGISGHMGSRAIYLIQLLIQKKTGIDLNDTMTHCDDCELSCVKEDDKK